MDEIKLSILKLEMMQLEGQIKLLQSRLSDMRQLEKLAQDYLGRSKQHASVIGDGVDTGGVDSINQATELTRITASSAMQALSGTIVGSGFVTTKKDRILGAVREILVSGGRRSSRQLAKELETRGIELSGADETKKAAALSAYLSRENEFESDVKAGGWALKQNPLKAKPGNAPTLPGLFTNIGSQATHS